MSGFVGVGGLFGLLYGLGIGSNDLANNFSSPVAAKTYKLREALVMGFFFEFIGSIVLGSNSHTFGSKMLLPEALPLDVPLLQLIHLSALIGAVLWLSLCNLAALPVSTTHIISAAMVGAGLAAKADCIDTEAMGQMMVSAVVSPLTAAATTIVIYGSTRYYLLKKENATELTLSGYPVSVGFAIGVVTVFVMLKTNALDGKDIGLKNDTDFFFALAGLTSAISLMMGFGIRVYLLPIVKNRLGEVHVVKQKDRMKSILQASKGAGTSSGTKEGKKRNWIQKINNYIFEVDLQQIVFRKDPKAEQIQKTSQEMNSGVETTYMFLHGLVVIFSSIVHGAKDVANAAAPLGVIVALSKQANGKVKASYSIAESWPTLLAGVGIAVGGLCLSRNLFSSLGHRIARFSPVRGFIAQLSAIIVIILGSQSNVSFSTTHCWVGACVGIGLVDGFWKGYSFKNGLKEALNNFNWKYVGLVVANWYLSFAGAGLLGAIVFFIGKAAI